MSSHHECTTDPHVHEAPFLRIPYGWVVHVDHEPVAICLRPNYAARIVELLAEHGVVAVPDHLPDDLVWGPPITEPLIDLRLPADPTQVHP